MPLINTIRDEPGFKQISLQHQFNTLPQSDKIGVIKLIESGRAGHETDALELSEMGMEFVRRSEFHEIYGPQSPPQNEMAPVVQGLMEIIRTHHATTPAVTPHGQINPRYRDLVGGDDRHSTTNKPHSCPKCGHSMKGQ
jgi:hypothetical protein